MDPKKGSKGDQKCKVGASALFQNLPKKYFFAILFFLSIFYFIFLTKKNTFLTTIHKMLFFGQKSASKRLCNFSLYFL